MVERREVMAGRSGSGPLGAVAQICWFGQPAQASLVPAVVDSGPGQWSGWELVAVGVVGVGGGTRFGGDELGHLWVWVEETEWWDW